MTRKIGKELIDRMRQINDSLESITPSASDSPQPIDACALHARESQRLQPDRLTLTDAEREAIRFAAVFYEMGGRAEDAATLRGLLERLAPARDETPPEPASMPEREPS